MDDKLYGLNESQMQRLKRLLDALERGDIPTIHRNTKRDLRPSRVLVGILTSAVSATTALTGKPKVGELNVYSFTSTGTEAMGLTEKCYNFAPQSATTDRWTVCERCNMTGNWVISTQFCS